MLTDRHQLDVLEDYRLGIDCFKHVADYALRINPNAAKKRSVGLGDFGGSVFQSRPIGIFADCLEKFDYCRLDAISLHF